MSDELPMCENYEALEEYRIEERKKSSIGLKIKINYLRLLNTYLKLRRKYGRYKSTSVDCG